MTDHKPTTLDHYDNVTLARSILENCETLFVAIEHTAKANDSDKLAFSQIYKLAGIGQQMALEWSSQFNDFADEINKHLPRGEK